MAPDDVHFRSNDLLAPEEEVVHGDVLFYGIAIAIDSPLADAGEVVADLDDVPAELLRLARPGDLVLTLGAGSVTDVGPVVLALLEDS